MSTHTEMNIGSRVALAQDYTQLPGTVIPRGAMGTVVGCQHTTQFVAVRLDDFPDGFDEWNGELWFDRELEPAYDWLVVA